MGVARRVGEDAPSGVNDGIGGGEVPLPAHVRELGCWEAEVGVEAPVGQQHESGREADEEGLWPGRSDGIANASQCRDGGRSTEPNRCRQARRCSFRDRGKTSVLAVLASLQPGPLAGHARTDQPTRGVEGDAEDGATVDDKSNQDIELPGPFHKLIGAVERIDDPTAGRCEAVGVIRALLGKDRVIGKASRKRVPDDAVGGEVGIGDGRAVRLGVGRCSRAHVEIVDRLAGRGCRSNGRFKFQREGLG